MIAYKNDVYLSVFRFFYAITSPTVHLLISHCTRGLQYMITYKNAVHLSVFRYYHVTHSSVAICWQNNGTKNCAGGVSFGLLLLSRHPQAIASPTVHLLISHCTRGLQYPKQSNRRLTSTHCNTLQHTATHCNALQRMATQCNKQSDRRLTATHCNTLQRTATHCNTLQHTSTATGDLQGLLVNLVSCSSVLQCCSVLQCVAVCCSVLQCVAVCCSVLQCVAVCVSW